MIDPPRVAEWLLRHRLDQATRDEVLGDLREDFDGETRERGPDAARRWYWRQAWSFVSMPTPAEDARLQSRRYRRMSFDDVRFAVRRLRKRPAATVISVVTLATAIGAAVATWSVLSALLLRPVPVGQAERLVVVGTRYGTRPGSLGLFGLFPIYEQIRDAGIFESVAGGGGLGVLSAVVGGTPTPISPYYASVNFLDVLELHPEAGRWFVADEDRAGVEIPAVLSDRFWRRAFDADPSVLGRPLVINGHLTTIVGVAPRGFRGLDLTNAPDVYLPLHDIATLTGPGFNFFSSGVANGNSPTAWVRTVGRLKPNQSAEAAAAALATFSVLPDAKETFGVVDIETASLAEGARPPLRQFSRLVAATVGLLLVIGCLAVGMQLLLRTEARRAEFAMCLAMGATRARLVGGVFLEGALLALAGAALAVPASLWLIGSVTSFQLPGGIDLSQLEIAIDRHTFLATALAAVAATLAMTAVAAGFSFTTGVADALRARAGTTPRIGRPHTRAALVVTNVGVTVVLLLAAGLFVRSLSAALSLNPGYDTGRIATGSVRAPLPAVAGPFFDDLGGRLRRLPAVRSVSVYADMGGMSAGGRWAVDGQKRALPSFLSVHAIDDHYFATLGISVVQGRGFTTDDRLGGPSVGIVSESFGRFLANGGDPLGHHIDGFGGRAPGASPAQIAIVGVVPDIVTSVRALEPLAAYAPIAQVADDLSRRPVQYRSVMIHTTGESSVALRGAAEAIHNADPSAIPPRLTTIDDQIRRQMSPQEFGATVIGTLGGIATLLTLFGIFVLVESMSTLRRREMGVRAALGARGRQLSGLILRETLALVGGGIAVGLVVSYVGAGLIRAFLFHVQPFDALTLVLVVAGMTMLALAVSLRPALGAGRVDLAAVLREE